MNLPSAFGFRRSKLPRKAVCCPHCHIQQQEPLQVQSTYCRSCGLYFQPEKSESYPTIAPIIRQRSHKNERQIRCFVCTATHTTSPHTELTVCPECGTQINLRDIRIDHPVSQMVDTRGTLWITRQGFLTNTSTICGAAQIKGGWVGRLYCDGPVRLGSRGRFNSLLIAQEVIIERHADIQLNFPIHTAKLEIRGRLIASIKCSGPIHIFKKGYLEGDIHGRSFVVDKGGSYSGSLSIGTLETPAPPSDHPYARPEEDRLRVVRHKPRRKNAPDRYII